MWLTGARFCDFVVYLPEKTSIERFEANYEYVREFLLPCAVDFYFAKYLPTLIAKQRGWISEVGDLPDDVRVERYRPDVSEHYRNYK